MKVSECKLTYRHPRRERPKITSAKDAFPICLSNWEKDIEYVERFKILLLGPDNRCKGVFQVSQGAMTSTLIDKRVLFSAAITAAACGIILVHNHPSGDCNPSQADIKATNDIMKCGEILDIKVLDHLIISRNQFYSFTESSILYP